MVNQYRIVLGLLIGLATIVGLGITFLNPNPDVVYAIPHQQSTATVTPTSTPISDETMWVCPNGELPLDRNGRTVDLNTVDDLDTIVAFTTAEANGQKLTGAILDDAQAVAVNLNQWTISFTLTNEGDDLFATYTQNHIGSPLAIVIDGMVLSAPTIQNRISGEGQITGDFSREDAEVLATYLTFGVLPIQIEIVSWEITNESAILTVEPIQELTADTLEETQDILTQRAERLSLDLQIKQSDSDTIALLFSKDVDQAVASRLVQTGLLEFVDVSTISFDLTDRCIITDEQIRRILAVKNEVED